MKNKVFAAISFLLFCSLAMAQDDHVWDGLRPLSDFAVQIDVPVKLVVFLLSLSVFAISFLAYNKSKSKRILLVTIAFLLFSLKWLVKLLDIFYSPGTFLGDSSENIFELGILISLLVALFYKGSESKIFAKRKGS